MTTRRSPATAALLGLLVVEIAVATAAGVVLVSAMTADDGPIVGPLDPTALGVLTVASSMLVVVVALLCAAVVGLWRGRPWAASIAGIVQALLLVGAGVGLFSAGWQPLLAVIAAVSVLGLLLIAGRARRRVPH